jgi:hypothetical protein
VPEAAATDVPIPRAPVPEAAATDVPIPRAPANQPVVHEGDDSDDGSAGGFVVHEGDDSEEGGGDGFVPATVPVSVVVQASITSPIGGTSMRSQDSVDAASLSMEEAFDQAIKEGPKYVLSKTRTGKPKKAYKTEFVFVCRCTHCKRLGIAKARITLFDRQVFRRYYPGKHKIRLPAMVAVDNDGFVSWDEMFPSCTEAKRKRQCLREHLKEKAVLEEGMVGFPVCAKNPIKIKADADADADEAPAPPTAKQGSSPNEELRLVMDNLASLQSLIDGTDSESMKAVLKEAHAKQMLQITLITARMGEDTTTS